MSKAGGRVRELRKARRWSQQRLGDEAGVTAQTVWNLETGRHVPETETLFKIARALGVSLGELLTN
jgi:transcriptional regulator with XRE-family HTH domain